MADFREIGLDPTGAVNPDLARKIYDELRNTAHYRLQDVGVKVLAGSGQRRESFSTNSKSPGGSNEREAPKEEIPRLNIP